MLLFLVVNCILSLLFLHLSTIDLAHHLHFFKGILQVVCLVVSLDQLLLPVFILFGVWKTNKVILFDRILLLEPLLDLLSKLVLHALLPSIVIIKKVISVPTD